MARPRLSRFQDDVPSKAYVKVFRIKISHLQPRAAQGDRQQDKISKVGHNSPRTYVCQQVPAQQLLMNNQFPFQLAMSQHKHTAQVSSVHPKEFMESRNDADAIFRDSRF
ncbi:predicted protein [Histoplasma capsulatum G186AR]|uniref:Uncharacterized protein n=1 Tax=Ajellomyces capsulatus (strain G186AR / H82 / ATCC MYA-2454 / RMSCC 2432) TaxID=447093 RepID=C0NMN0_AJECG|nr:uncharacterized protein HCBG_04007 [Histoplasma capsulatum G186AR]EEH07128.1 predicted protein [Histoplasma capsulatum G186AR]